MRRLPLFSPLREGKPGSLLDRVQDRIAAALNTVAREAQRLANLRGAAPVVVTHDAHTATVSMPKASSTADGYLAASDFASFASAAGVHHVVGETPTGSVNGTDGTDGNATFTLAHTPIEGSVEVVKTRAVMLAGIDYTVSGNKITFLAPQIPMAWEWVRVNYRY